MDPFLDDLTKHMIGAIEDPGTACATEAFVLSSGPSDWPMTIAEIAAAFDVPPILLIPAQLAQPASAVPGLCDLSEY